MIALRAASFSPFKACQNSKLTGDGIFVAIPPPAEAAEPILARANTINSDNSVFFITKCLPVCIL